MWWNDGSGWWFAMPLLMVAFWIAALGVVAWLVASLARGRGVPPRDESARAARPEDVLAERYARGEIDDDEYRRRLDVLREAREAGTQR